MALTGASLGPGLPRGRAPADWLRPARRARGPRGESLQTYEDVEQRAKELFAMEHHGDELSHAIGSKLNTTFVTPFDREDIHALISGLDDVLDLIEEIADTFILYHVDAPTPASVQQATIIRKQCEAIHEALTKLKSFQGLQKYWIEIHRLENDGDRIARA